MKAERQRDERGRFVKTANGGDAAQRLMTYTLEAPDRLRAIAEDPETPVKLKLEIEQFFFELAYGKGGLAMGEPGSIKFEGKLEEWSR